MDSSANMASGNCFFHLKLMQPPLPQIHLYYTATVALTKTNNTITTNTTSPLPTRGPFYRWQQWVVMPGRRADCPYHGPGRGTRGTTPAVPVTVPQLLCNCLFPRKVSSFKCYLNLNQKILYLADPGKVIGCSTNTSVTNSLINLLADGLWKYLFCAATPWQGPL